LTATNLFPVIGDVAIKERDLVEIFGTDYPTADGSAVRDYVHVMDLAEGHVSAIHSIVNNGSSGDEFQVINLGTGKGSSVYEIINLYREISREEIQVVESPRRPGDLPEIYADPSKAKQMLNWSAKRNLRKMVADEWNFRRSCQ
jgi:UDP-glucose 4-epimerase